MDEAADWHARRLAPDWDDAQQAAFDIWRTTGPENQLACRRIERVLQLTALLPQRARVSPPEKGWRPQGKWTLAWAASACCVIAAAILVMAGRHTLQAGAEVFTNTSSSTAEYSLPDGSTLELDAGSRVRVLFDDGQRRLELLAGRAVFVVVEDAHRPFQVSAGDSLTTAFGTLFQIERDADSVKITPATGNVVVTSSRSCRAGRASMSRLH